MGLTRELFVAIFAAGFFFGVLVVVGSLVYLISRAIDGWNERCKLCGRWWAAVLLRRDVTRRARRRGTRTRWNTITTAGVGSDGKPTNVTNWISHREPVDELVFYYLVRWRCRYCCEEWTTNEVQTCHVWEEEID